MNAVEKFEAEYEKHVAELMRHLASFIDGEFGQRCDTFCDECPACKLWQAHDEIYKIIKI